jgi:hypothetical protein
MATCSVTVVAATRLEARAVRRALHRVLHRVLADARVLRAGVALSRLRAPLEGAVVTCGLAGAVRPGVPAGTVLVPSSVLRADGSLLACDPELTAVLASAALSLGLPLEQAPLASGAELIVGEARRRWADRGCAAADMETGLLTAERVAAVRVVLDTPERELAAAWRRPMRALLSPAAWRELPWLAGEAPRCARRAAAVLAAALAPVEDERSLPALAGRIPGSRWLD